MEHLQHFGLRLDPFQIEPDLRFYYDSATHGDTQRRVERGLRQSKGLSILTGESGTGKSLLARRLFGGLEEELFEAALMVVLPGTADARSVVTRFARHLEIEDLSDDPSRAMAQVYEQLAVVREDGRHSVLILDDAHLLGSEALAEVGALLSLEYEDRRLVSILLVGMPDLATAIADDRSLGERVDIRVRLSPLDLDSAEAYLQNRLQVAGGDPAILSAEAVEALVKHGLGRPRRMNTLADNALFEAYLAGRPHIEAFDVERAAADLADGGGPDSPQPASVASSAAALPPSDMVAPPASPVFETPEPEFVHPAGEPAAEQLVEEVEADLDLDWGDNSNSEESFEFADSGATEQTRLMLSDDPEPMADGDPIESMQFDSGVILGDDEPAEIELGEPIGPGDELGIELDGRALDLGDDDEDATDLELGDLVEPTRMIVPEEAPLDAGEPLDSEGDEIEALFDQLLDD